MGSNKVNSGETAVVLNILKTGNESFIKSISEDRALEVQVKKTSLGQTPFAAVLSCIDSRVPVETIFGLGIGDIFSFRSAGNFVDQKIEENNDILGSLEFAKASGVQLILVLGHSSCGAVKAAIGKPDPKWPPSLDLMVDRLRTNIKTKDADVAIRENVRNTIKYIKEHSKFLSEFEIIGGVYDITTGAVNFLGENG